MTRPGAILGTLGYFAPELGSDVRPDERSDQFGFCATLYRALYQRPAFATDDLIAYVQSAKAGPRPPPAGSGVPGWVHQVIVKGLSVRPDDRYPSMDALLAALERDPTRVRRRRLGLLALVAGAALGALGYLRREHVIDAGCVAAGGAAREVWSDEARARVDAAVGEGRVGSVLDEYAARWSAVRTGVCRSARRQEAQAAAALAAGCLEHARQDLAAMVDLLGRSGGSPAARALRAAYSLLPPEACTSPSLSRGYAALPADAGERERLLALLRRQAGARALLAAGRYREALAAAEQTLALAREADQRAAQAESAQTAGDIHLRLGNATEAIAAYLTAMGAAEAAGHDDLAGSAAAMIAYATGVNLHKADDADRWIAIARGKLARLGHDEKLEATILHTEILAASAEGPLPATLARYERLLSLDERIWGPVSDPVASDVNNLAIALGQGGEHARAIDEYRRALSLKETLYGPAHPDLASSLENLAAELCAVGRYAEADVPAARALSLVEKLGRDGDLKLAWALLPLAVIAGRRGDAPRALSLADRALAVAGRHGEDAAAVLPDLLVARGDALLALGRADDAAASCVQALARMEAEGRVSPGKVYEPDPLTCLGEADLRRGRAAEGLAYLERGVTLVRRHEEASLAFARFALARAIYATGQDRVRSKALATEARAGFSMLPDLADKRAEVETFLARGSW
jgi:tetratricopeptide (TPR) repeat protein